jgi:hypothetical protein
VGQEETVLGTTAQQNCLMLLYHLQKLLRFELDERFAVYMYVEMESTVKERSWAASSTALTIGPSSGEEPPG